ncbi:nucleotide-binding domain containing protein [Brachybacterium sp. GPGPB12]|uniref:nucleotide-binding domain containing protein n=1 Tax=Brachybacterium sp. GPGPB12 TaxID=3023517 RepID=UPI0031345AF5
MSGPGSSSTRPSTRTSRSSPGRWRRSRRRDAPSSPAARPPSCGPSSGGRAHASSTPTRSRSPRDGSTTASSSSAPTSGSPPRSCAPSSGAAPSPSSRSTSPPCSTSAASEDLAGVSAQAAETLRSSDCVVFTSRDLVRTDDPAESLAIARGVSDAVVEVVRRVREAKPAWVVAKGGITSHEVAENGLGIRRARVEGQFWPGQVSLFSAQEAPDEVLGAPYVVFPGNVGGEQALADVVDVLTASVAAR